MRTRAPAREAARQPARRPASDSARARTRARVGGASVAAWSATALCLVGGYADLAAGGVTVGAILLVLGYAVALPSALLIVPGARD